MFNLITTPNYMFDAFIRDAECAKKITLSNWFSKSWKWYPTSCFYRCQHDLWFTTHSQSDEGFAVTKNIQVWTLKIYPKSLRNVKQMGSCQNFWCFHTGNLADLTECEFGGTFRLYSIHFQPGSTYMLWLIANAVLMLFMGSLTCLHLYVVLSHKNKYDILIKLWEKNHSTSYAIQQFGKIKRSFLTPDDFLVAWTKSAESGGNSHADESAKLAVEHGTCLGSSTCIPSQNTVDGTKSGDHHLLLHETPQIMGYLPYQLVGCTPIPKYLYGKCLKTNLYHAGISGLFHPQESHPRTPTKYHWVWSNFDTSSRVSPQLLVVFWKGNPLIAHKKT